MSQHSRCTSPLVSARIACPDRSPPEGLAAALAELRLTEPRPVLILVGGAANLDAMVGVALLALFEGLAPRLDTLDAAVIDGGTSFGVMALMGQAHRRTAARFPLLGIAPRGLVAIDPNPAGVGLDHLAGDSDGKVLLEPNHTHFMLVPGERWGDESPWINNAAEFLAKGRGTLMLVASGGDITRLDVMHRLRAGGRVLVLAGSGGTADRLARWRRARGAIPEFDLGEADRSLIEVVELAEAATRLPGILALAFAP